jgi:hypothetical protein
MIAKQAFLLWVNARTVLAHVIAKIRDTLASLLGLEWCPPTAGNKIVQRRWLSKRLEREVTSLELKPLDENRGFVGSMLRVDITCDEIPLSLVLKTSFPQNRRNLVIGAGGVREGIFYQSRYSKRLQDLGRTPKAYYSNGSQWFGESVLLMEDLRRCTPVNHLFGNQTWGKPDNVPKVDQIELLKAMYHHAAEMHAQYWNDERLLYCSWMRSSEWFHGRGKIIWELSMDFSRKGWDQLMDVNDIEFPKDFVKIVNKSYQKLSWEHVKEYLKKLPFTLTHGDYHAANMMVDLSKNTLLDGLKVFDWSEVGPWEPTTDLAQTIISDVPPHLFPQVLEVLNSYHEQLSLLGVENYSWEDCRTRFAESGMERWIWILGVMAWFKCPATLYQYFVNQMDAFRLEFCPEHDFFRLKTCGYLLPNSLPA